MNLSRTLFVIPVLFAAAITGAACSSSSSGGTGSESTKSSGGNSSSVSTDTADCTKLGACCATLTAEASAMSACNAAVAAGNACAATLAEIQADNFCTSTGSSSSSTVTSGSSNSSSVTGSSGTSGSTGSTGSTGPVTGCNPHPLSGFTATPNFPPAANCTTAQAKATVLDCFELSDAALTDAGSAACDNALFTNGDIDAGFGSCGQCVLTLATGTTWGAFIAIESPTAIGATTTTESDLFDIGGCVARADTTSAGQACATALNELSECEFNSCVPYCPVATPQDTAGQDALLGDGSSSAGCLGNADTVICASYVTAADTACQNESNDAGTGALDKCQNLVNDALTATGAVPQAFENYIGLLCGGYDAGI